MNRATEKNSTIINYYKYYVVEVIPTIAKPTNYWCKKYWHTSHLFIWSSLCIWCKKYWHTNHLFIWSSLYIFLHILQCENFLNTNSIHISTTSSLTLFLLRHIWFDRLETSG